MKTAMRIQVLATIEASSISGSAKAVLEFAREASRSQSQSTNVELSIVSFNRSEGENGLAASIRKSGIRHDIIHERRAFDRRIIAQLRQVTEARKPDVIWTNSVKSHFLIRFAGLNRLAKWVAFHHGYTATDTKMRIYNQFDRWSLPAADRVLTVCRPFAEQLRSRNVAARRISIQHMPIRAFEPVPRDRIDDLRRQLGITSQTRVLLSVGRLSLEKGHSNLIRAFHAYRQGRLGIPVKLAFVGEGPERQRLENLSRQLGLKDDVAFVGQQEDVNPYYAIAYAFALPSHSEGSPNVLLEAMSAGVPVIATSVGGVPEIVADGIDALLVEKRDIDGLADSISRMFEDNELHERLRSAGQKVVQRHTPAAFYRSIASVLQETLCE